MTHVNVMGELDHDPTMFEFGAAIVMVAVSIASSRVIKRHAAASGRRMMNMLAHAGADPKLPGVATRSCGTCGAGAASAGPRTCATGGSRGVEATMTSAQRADIPRLEQDYRRVAP